MRRKIIFKSILGGLLLAMLTPLNTLLLTSCSDEPDSEYFYTFTGEMMSDWLKSPERPQYSEFAEIVERAGLMNLLATYGHYTCFAPSNDAVLHRVILQVKFDMCQSFKNDNGITVAVESRICCQISIQHVHSRQLVSNHIVCGVHIRHQMRTGDGITIGIAQL